MSLIEIVERLQAEGNSISWRQRSDGGIIVTSINGRKFVGAEGNRIARFMVGATLSENRARQLESIRPKRVSVLSNKIKYKIAKVQKKWKKNVKPSQGKITTGKVRWNIEHLGEKEALRKLGEAEKYASGIAYGANIDRLLEYIDHFINMYSAFGEDESADKMMDLYDKIDANRDKIKENNISAIYDTLYKLNSNPDDIDEIIKEVELLIR